MLAAIATLLLAVGAAPVPKVTGPIPVTADSYPFLAANKSTPAFDLSKVGYVEEEYIVTGNANVYDWAADGSLTVKTPNAPYGTRILVRRPANPARFSGTVIVEPLMPARRFDWPMMWGFSHEYFFDHGKPIYDGYVLKAAFTMTRLNQCAPQPAANDPRQAIKNVGVPVIEVAAQGEIIGGTYPTRRADSDEPNDRFRLYEVAAAGHIDRSAYFGFPRQEDQIAAVGSAQGTPDWPFNAKCDPEIPL